MNTVLPWCWTAILILSIAWYVVMIGYVGLRGGWEIRQMTRTLSQRPANGPPAPPEQG